MTRSSLSVAVPWSLSHYIPFDGFHPLYRALINECPTQISVNGWDNLALSNMLRGEKELQKNILSNVEQAHSAFYAKMTSTFTKKHVDEFFVPNIALTSLLPGDIEFHHTVPFPSMTRPFVFHCESLVPIFSRFMQQGGEIFDDAEGLREYYSKIFADPLCMGIFSHIPHTLEEISRFFRSPHIDAKLYLSRIGLSQRALTPINNGKMNTLRTPCFLFINSANREPASFAQRGGHIVLRFWLKFIDDFPGAKLYLRSARPADDVLSELGVDIVRLRKEEARSVIWIQEFNNDRELDRLISRAHFYLQPSESLHSVSIMRAMGLGAVPFVSDTIGTECYVTHGKNGIVLDGVRANNLVTDQEAGLLMGHDYRNLKLEDDLVRQIERSVARLIDKPSDYEAMQRSTIEAFATEFSGAAFSKDFWHAVEGLWNNFSGPKSHGDTACEALLALQHCLVKQSDWQRIFESVPQPMARIATGRGRVTELAGAFVYTEGNRQIDQHEWSVLAEYWKPGAPALSFVNNISELEGEYLTGTAMAVPNTIVGFCTRLLLPYPRIYRLASRILKLARRWWRKTETKGEPAYVDIQLVAQGISGMNVIRCNHCYYAIPQEGGEFSEERANNGGYRLCFKGNSLRSVLAKIAEYGQTAGLLGPRADANRPVPILVEEGFVGFNIVYYADSFFAIPQNEGAFEHERVMASGYSQFHVGMTLEATKLAIAGATK